MNGAKILTTDTAYITFVVSEYFVFAYSCDEHLQLFCTLTLYIELYYHYIALVYIGYMDNWWRERRLQWIRTPATRKDNVLSQAGTKENDNFQRRT
jgi:hypothetical protein